MTLIVHPASVKRACLGFVFLWCISMWASPSLAAVHFPKPEGPVNDFAKVISPAYRQKMAAVIMELFQKTGIPVVVVTMPDIGGADIDEYANRLYQAWGIGKKGVDKGILVFVALKERKMRIEVGYGLEGVITDGMAGEIRDRDMVPYLSKNRFGEGLLNGVVAIAQIIAKSSGVKLTGQVPPAPQRKRTSALPFFPIVLIFLLFFVARRRGGSWLFFLPLLMGGGPRFGSGGIGGGFGGFGGGFGGFGGFGGGLSGGGGASGGF